MIETSSTTTTRDVKLIATLWIDVNRARYDIVTITTMRMDRITEYRYYFMPRLCDPACFGMRGEAKLGGMHAQIGMAAMFFMLDSRTAS